MNISHAGSQSVKYAVGVILWTESL